MTRRPTPTRQKWPWDHHNQTWEYSHGFMAQQQTRGERGWWIQASGAHVTSGSRGNLLFVRTAKERDRVLSERFAFAGTWDPVDVPKADNVSAHLLAQHALVGRLVVRWGQTSIPLGPQSLYRQIVDVYRDEGGWHVARWCDIDRDGKDTGQPVELSRFAHLALADLGRRADYWLGIEPEEVAS